MLKFCRNESRLEFLGILMKYYNKEIETMSRENLFALQSERLVKQVRNVYDRVPYYRAKMDAIGLKPEDVRSISDISKLPFTVKTDIRANYPFGLFGCDRKKVVRLHASSGTTGKLTVVGYTKRDLNTWAECCARAMTSAGLTKNDTVHIAYGYGLFTGGLGLHYGDSCPRFDGQHDAPTDASERFRRDGNRMHPVVRAVSCGRVENRGAYDRRPYVENRHFRRGTMDGRNAPRNRRSA